MLSGFIASQRPTDICIIAIWLIISDALSLIDTEGCGNMLQSIEREIGTV